MEWHAKLENLGINTRENFTEKTTAVINDGFSTEEMHKIIVNMADIHKGIYIPEKDDKNEFTFGEKWYESKTADGKTNGIIEISHFKYLIQKQARKYDCKYVKNEIQFKMKQENTNLELQVMADLRTCMCERVDKAFSQFDSLRV